MAGASTAVAYEAQVHFGITMWLAELRGFSEAEAYEIAKHDQAVDDDPETEPFWDWDSAGIRSRSEYHFVNKARLDQMRMDALGCTFGRISVREFRRIGQFLHALEDVYSHKPYGPKLGHGLAGHTPDKPWNNPAGFVEMIRAKSEALGVILAKCTKPSHAESVALERFQRATEELNSWSTTEYSFGTGDPDAESRWDPLLRKLFGQRYDIYMVKYAQAYQDWVKEQKRGGWKKP